MNVELGFIECECERCKGACTYKPGWFKPDEIEPLADNLGLSIKELFESRLSVDWFYGENASDNIFLLAPTSNRSLPGEEYPYDATGTCTFYKKGLCEIHSFKPFECKEYIHGTAEGVVSDRHEETAKSWINHQALISKLLGRDPITSEPDSLMDAFRLLY